MAELLIGSSGWDYAHPVEKGGWVGPFYPNSQTARLQFYSQFFPTVEIDATFCDSTYSKMTKRTFYDMVKAVPSNFQFSIRVPENITHIKRLDSRRHATVAFQNFLDKISPLKDANKIGAILLHIPSSFLVNEFKHIDGFLDKLPLGYDYAMEFHNLSCQIEGSWKMLRHYNVAAVMRDSPDVQPKDITNIPMTSDHVLIRLDGLVEGSKHNYFYNEEQLRSWADKINQLRRDRETKILRIYFNNHYGAKAIANAIQLKELLGEKISEEEKKTVQKITDAINRVKTEKQFLDSSEA
jgi:uncharacterized protein YecE (DUF72 family)